MITSELALLEQEGFPTVSVRPTDVNDYNFFENLVQSPEEGLQRMFSAKTRANPKPTFEAITGGNNNIIGLTIMSGEDETAVPCGLATISRRPRTETSPARITVGIGLTAEARGKKIGRRVVEYLKSIVPAEWESDTDSIEAMIFPDNTDSMNLFYASGFKGIQIIPDETGTRYYYVMSIPRNTASK